MGQLPSQCTSIRAATCGCSCLRPATEGVQCGDLPIFRDVYGAEATATLEAVPLRLGEQCQNIGVEDELAWKSRQTFPFSRRNFAFCHRGFDIEDYYLLGKELGRGAFGCAYEAMAKGSTSGKAYARVAVKTFRLAEGADEPLDCTSPRTLAGTPRSVSSTGRKRSNDGSVPKPSSHASDHKIKTFEHELVMLSTMEHPHIVRLIEAFVSKSVAHLVLELCEGGELYDRLVAQRGGLGEIFVRPLFEQMLLAVSYLHSQRVVHGDIKMENWLLFEPKDHPGSPTLKLCDFGVACRLTDAQPRLMQRCGTLSYTAPEAYQRKGIAMAADLWSLGVVLYTLLVGASPFRKHGEPSSDTMQRICSGEFDQSRPGWSVLSLGAKQLVEALLVVQEGGRLTAEQSLRHAWTLFREPTQAAGCAFGCGNLSSGAHLNVVPEGQSSREMASSKEIEFFHDEEVIVPSNSYMAFGVESASYMLRLFLRFAQLDGLQRVLVQACALRLAGLNEMPAQDFSWRDEFVALDRNADGRVSPKEIVACLAHGLGVSTRFALHDLEILVSLLDTDGSGFIEWGEWLVLVFLGSAEEYKFHMVDAEHEDGLDNDFTSLLQPSGALFRLLDGPSGDSIVSELDLNALTRFESDEWEGEPDAADFKYFSGRIHPSIPGLTQRWRSAESLMSNCVSQAGLTSKELQAAFLQAVSGPVQQISSNTVKDQISIPETPRISKEQMSAPETTSGFAYNAMDGRSLQLTSGG